ncbi:MAG: zinc ribbon domain-containing protein [Cyanobacteriota bacterium]
MAVKCGKVVIGDNPNGTSQECSGCAETVQKSLADRVHHCPYCGLVLDKDFNAAINILNRVRKPLGLRVSGCGGYLDASPMKQQLLIVRLGSPFYAACG